MQNNMLFISLHVSTVLIFILLYYILQKPKKSQLHYAFLANLGLLLIWSLSVITETYMQYIDKDMMIYFEYLTYIGISFLPVSLLLTGLIFAHTKIKLKWKHKLLFIVPIITTIVIWTNGYHHLFYEKFSFASSEYVPGSYFIIHSMYSYILLLIALSYLVYVSIKNSGIFSKQAFLIILGTVIPLAINVLYTLKIIKGLTIYATPLSFSFLVACYIFATIKYNFLKIAPIALQKVVDLISDSFVVVNEELKVIDYNKAFIDTFAPLFKVKRNDNFINAIRNCSAIGIDADKISKIITISSKRRKSIVFERHIRSNSFDKYFTIEVTPIIARDNFIGTIVLLKDITQSKKDLQIIKEKQGSIMKERVESMGQVIGGLAHNLKTPLMSISGAVELLQDLVKEYEESVGEKSVTADDLYEIVKEMKEWIGKMKPNCTYISDIITSVKAQSVKLNASSNECFTLNELVKRIDLLMKQELIEYDCSLKCEYLVNMDTKLKGDVNSLIQVFDNIIVNALHAYEGKSGVIDFTIKNVGENIVFILRDYGKGIQPDIKDKLFKQMVTTKGKDGTGLGLYVSYSNITGRFGGNMWFESEEGKGTAFYISIPSVKDYIFREAVQ